MKNEILSAKAALLNHEVICFPTETVMGLGVFYNDFEAYNRLNLVKERPEDKPYTMMVKSVDEIDKYAYVDQKAKRVIERFMPGSLTVLLKAKDNVPGYVTHNTGIIGIRIPTNKEAVDLLNEVDIPLLVPSANKSGKSPAMNSAEAKDIFNDEIGAYVSGSCIGGVPSTLVDLTKDEPFLIRKGPISFDAIKAIFHGYKFIDTVVTYLVKDNKVLMLYRNKKQNDINQGKWIGIGGHIEKGETPYQAAIREFKEETSLTIDQCEEKGVVTFFFNNDVEVMHIFTCSDYQGEVDYSCNEGTLKWIPIEELFDISLWEGDKLFLKPILFENKPFIQLSMRYDGDKLIDYKEIK